jgi:drug/metabolite transporter (DMT)-like permease
MWKNAPRLDLRNPHSQKGDISICEPSLRHQTYKGIALRICGTLFFGVMGALIKQVSDAYPTGEIIFARAIFMVFPIFAVLLAQGELLRGISVKKPLIHLSRVGTGIISMFCNFAALRFLPLPDATAIGFAAPLITVIFSVFLLKEKARFHRWLAVSAGLLGVLMIFSPHIVQSFAGSESRNALLGALLALAGAVFSAFSMISIRRLAKTEKTSAIVFYFAIGAAAAGALTAPFGWVAPTPVDGIILVMLGLLGGVGQILMTHSYRYAEASVVAPFDYVLLLWAIILGWLFFADAPSWQMLTGAALVIVSGVYVIWREHGEITALQETGVKA